MECALIFDRYL